MRCFPVLFLCFVSGAIFSQKAHAEVFLFNNPLVNPACGPAACTDKSKGKATVVVANQAEAVNESRDGVEVAPAHLVTQSPKEIASWIEKSRDANPFQLRNAACLKDFLEAASVSMTLAGFHIAEFKANKMETRKTSIRGGYVQAVEEFELRFEAGSQTEVRKIECERKDWHWE